MIFMREFIRGLGGGVLRRGWRRVAVARFVMLGMDGAKIRLHRRRPRQIQKMFELARAYTQSDMTGYVALQEREFGMESEGYTATRHQREVGAGYFDDVATVISGGTASTLALVGSTEAEQF